MCSVTTPESLAAALCSLPAYASSPLARLMARYILPASIILYQNVSVKEAVGLAFAAVNGSSSGSSGGSSGVSLPLPLMISGPRFPMQLGVARPSIVRLDLTGCVGCLDLTDNTINVYLTQVTLTGG